MSKKEKFLKGLAIVLVAVATFLTLSFVLGCERSTSVVGAEQECFTWVDEMCQKIEGCGGNTFEDCVAVSNPELTCQDICSVTEEYQSCFDQLAVMGCDEFSVGGPPAICSEVLVVCD